MMKKKTLGMTAFVLVMGLTMTGCGKDPAQALQGTWTWTQESTEGEKLTGIRVFLPGSDFIAGVMSPDGSVQYRHEGYGTYAVTKDKLMISNNFGSSTNQYSLKGNTLTVTYEDGRTIAYQKKKAEKIPSGGKVLQGTWTGTVQGYSMNIIFYDNVMLFWAGGDFLYQGPFSVSGSNLTLYSGRKICPFTLSGDSLTLREFDDNIPTLVFQKKQAD